MVTRRHCGGFSELYILDGKAVKLLEDACYRDVLEECYKQNIAAEAGLAPRVHAVAKDGEDKVLIVMDAIDTDVWFNPDALDEVAPTLLGELPVDEMEIGLKLYCEMLLRRHRCMPMIPQRQLVYERRRSSNRY